MPLQSKWHGACASRLSACPHLCPRGAKPHSWRRRSSPGRSIISDGRSTLRTDEQLHGCTATQLLLQRFVPRLYFLERGCAVRAGRAAPATLRWCRAGRAGGSAGIPPGHPCPTGRCSAPRSVSPTAARRPNSFVQAEGGPRFSVVMRLGSGFSGSNGQNFMPCGVFHRALFRALRGNSVREYRTCRRCSRPPARPWHWCTSTSARLCRPSSTSRSSSQRWISRHRSSFGVPGSEPAVAQQRKRWMKSKRGSKCEVRSAPA